MKKRSRVLKAATIVALFGVLFVGSAWGYGNGQMQRGTNGECRMAGVNGMDLSEEQQSEIKELKISFVKELTPLKNELKIKKAELQAASVGDNIDKKAFYKIIDEVNSIKTQMAKKQFDHQMQVRNLLNDEQKVMFDARAGKGHGYNKGKMRHGAKGQHKNGMHKRGQGKGYGCKQGAQAIQVQ